MGVSRILKNRIRATKNIKQITKAMEAVSAVKMRRSQSFALRARPYALSALRILKDVRSRLPKESAELSLLLSEREVKKTCLVVITADKGLAGSFNTSVIRKAESLIRSRESKVSLVTIGKKGRDYFKRRNMDIVAEFTGAGDYGLMEESLHITKTIIDYFTDSAEEVILVYTNFLSALKQEIITRKILPFSEQALEEMVKGITPLYGRYANIPEFFGVQWDNSQSLIIEPHPKIILDKLLPELLHIEIHHAILEANASEHSSRMIAMKNASENAGDLVEKLNILYNKARQAAITKELSEITAGREALSN